MSKLIELSKLLSIASLTLLSVACQQSAESTSSQNTGIYPASDPNNKHGWVLNEEVSDEFEGTEVDEDRWYIVGKFEDGKPVYKDPDFPDREVWIGRAPSQFSGRNYRVEDGKLILETRWEPDFPFSDQPSDPWGPNKTISNYENITTAAFINRKIFKYGYMEIKSKAADAEITSALWMTRHESFNGQRNNSELELDIFEQFGSHRIAGQEHRDRELWWTIHDWNPNLGNENHKNATYTEKHDLGFRVADGFHTYGFEWTESGVRYFIDGELFTEVTREEVNAYAKKEGFKKGYVIDKAMHIWLDQETFPWRGFPESKQDLELNSPEGEKDDGVVDFEIEYLRVWQQPEK